MRASAATDVGMTREINQDSIFYSLDSIGNLPNLFMVADGMGGHKAGEVASRYAVSAITDKIRNNKCKDAVSVITSAIAEVNREIYEKSIRNEEYSGMGTTLVLATISKDNMLTVANIGDSRLYLSDTKLTQITRDHSYVEEMVEKGKIDRKDARTHKNKNIITRAVGAEAEIKPELFLIDVKQNEKILMCSDGLSNMIDDPGIHSIIKNSTDIGDAVQKLVSTANENGGTDNISVILIDSQNDNT